MKLPKHFVIHGHKIPLKKAKLFEAGLYGFYDRVERTITVDSRIKSDELKITLLHEVFHALFDRISVSSTLEKYQEEIIVDNIAKTLVENFNISVKKK